LDMPSIGRSCRSARRWLSLGRPSDDGCGQTRQAATNDDDAADRLLRDLKKHCADRRQILIWRWTACATRAAKMKQYLQSQRSWLESGRRLPGIFPNLESKDRGLMEATSKVRSWPTAVLPDLARPKTACRAAWLECASPSCHFLLHHAGLLFDLFVTPIMRELSRKRPRQRMRKNK